MGRVKDVLAVNEIHSPSRIVGTDLGVCNYGLSSLGGQWAGLRMCSPSAKYILHHEFSEQILVFVLMLCPHRRVTIDGVEGEHSLSSFNLQPEFSELILVFLFMLYPHRQGLWCALRQQNTFSVTNCRNRSWCLCLWFFFIGGSVGRVKDGLDVNEIHSPLRIVGTYLGVCVYVFYSSEG